MCVCVVVVVVESVMDNTLGYLWSIFRVNEFWKILLEKRGRTDEDTRCCAEIFGEWNFEGLRKEEPEASIVKATAQPRALLQALHFIDMNSADIDPRPYGSDRTTKSLLSWGLLGPVAVPDTHVCDRLSLVQITESQRETPPEECVGNTCRRKLGYQNII